MKFVTDCNEEAVREKLRQYQSRGFIADLIEAPVVAKERGSSILLSRRSSLGSWMGVRCVVRVTPVEHGSLIDGRFWHGPIFTTWFCFSYGLAFILLLASALAIFQSPSISEGIAVMIAGLLFGGFWIVATGVFNALLRAQRKGAIDELMTILSSIAKTAYDE